MRSPRHRRSSRSSSRDRHHRDHRDQRDHRRRSRERSRSPRDHRQHAPKEQQPNATVQKKRPDLGLSGLLVAEQNTTQQGIVLKYSEPPESRLSDQRYRLYVFKGKEQVDMLHLHRQSFYLFGKDRQVVDIPTDHPSCSKQHAVIQYRQINSRNEVGQLQQTVKPYLLDLASTNGTMLNSVKIEPSRYYELKQGDIINFGESTRDYVFLSEDSSD